MDKIKVGKIAGSDKRRNFLWVYICIVGFFGGFFALLSAFITLMTILNRSNSGYTDTDRSYFMTAVACFIVAVCIATIVFVIRWYEVRAYKKIYNGGEEIIVDVVHITQYGSVVHITQSWSMQSSGIFGLMYMLDGEIRKSGSHPYKRSEAIKIKDNKKIKLIYNREQDKVLYYKCKFAVNI